MTEKKKPARPRNIADDMIDAVEAATRKWTRQKKSEERHPGMIRYRVSRMTKEPRTTQKDAAWLILEEAYMAASGNGRLPALARQIFYQARPKIMAMTDDKELQYGYFSQTLLPTESSHLARSSPVSAVAAQFRSCPSGGRMSVSNGNWSTLIPSSSSAARTSS
jgi:hypothetical protein